MKLALLLLAACATVPKNAPPQALCNPGAFHHLSPGVAVVAFTVDTDGDVKDIAVRNADAPPDLVHAVQIYLSKCQFNPALRDGKPVAMRITGKFSSRD